MEFAPRLTDEVYSVSRLTQEIKEGLERCFPSVWVEGEVSNFRVPSSGHLYFTLKDASSQIRVVMFRSRAQSLPFVPGDGMQVTMRAGLTVYAPRGEYQLVAEWMAPLGRGSLHAAFEALKKKLAAEGLFDADRKRPLPYLPRCVGVVTSPTGAAVRDILKVLWRRFPGISVRFCPVRVQGAGAKEEIAAALDMLNDDGLAEVIIVGRGGGSLEDLWAFNEELVVRAIARSRIPVVSAVGHETDFTISDFVADLRAPTPSVAAELVIPERSALNVRLSTLRARLRGAVGRGMSGRRERLHHLFRRVRHPGRRVQDGFVRLDDLSERLSQEERRCMRDRRVRVEGLEGILLRVSPSRRIEAGMLRLHGGERDLNRCMQAVVDRKRQSAKQAAGRLDSLSPMGVLSRGYSIARLAPSGAILRDAGSVTRGDRVDVILSRGAIECTVEAVRGGRREEHIEP